MAEQEEDIEINDLSGDTEEELYEHYLSLIHISEPTRPY